MTADVFVSCANGDLDVVRALGSGLTERGIRPWVYAPAGGEWEPAILEVIRVARAVLIAASPRWEESDNCLRELELARVEGKPVVAVLIDGALPEPLRAADVELIGAGVSARTLDAIATWLAKPEPA